MIVVNLQNGGGLNATADLTVNILDSRSRPPYFVHLPYSVEVFENASIVNIIEWILPVYLFISCHVEIAL